MSDYKNYIGGIEEITVEAEGHITPQEFRDFKNTGTAVMDCGRIEDTPASLPDINIRVVLYYDEEENEYKVTGELE